MDFFTTRVYFFSVTKGRSERLFFKVDSNKIVLIVSIKIWQGIAL